MGLTMLRVLNDAVNPTLQSAGLPTLQIRVGADHGRASVTVLSVPATGYNEPDIAADALNRAVKIDKTCAPGTLRIGETLYRRIHVDWLERAVLTTTDISGPLGLDSYKVYEIK